jgi:hypothetical protein
MKRPLLVAALAAFVAVLTLGASAQGASRGTGCNNGLHRDFRGCMIGSASTSGDYATTIASGTATRPRHIFAVFNTSKPQWLDIDWTMVCSRGYGAGSKSGSVRRYSSVLPGVRAPTGGKGPWSISPDFRMPMARPDDCTVSAGAQLTRSGRLVIQILALR